jgi:hypothetical protein
MEKGWCALFSAQHTALMLIYPCINTPYRGVHTLVTSLDKAIPFIKLFVVPYAAWAGYISLSLVYLCFKDHKLAFKTILVFDLGLLICFIIYYFYQTEGPVRPVIIGHDFLSSILQYIYEIDHPYNSFPSIHVMSSYLLIRAIRNSSWKNKWHQWIIGCCSTSIILATMFIKQHDIMDVIAAIILVECLFKCVEFVYGWLLIQSRTLKDVAKKPSSYSA